MRTLRIGLVSAIACLLGAPAAHAGVTCTLNAGTKTLAIFAGATNDTPQLARTAGGALVVRSNATTPVACTNGSGTVTTVDAVELTDTTPAGAVNFTLDMTEGLLAPGATAEPLAGSEIEITAELGAGSDYVMILGRTTADTIRVGTPAAEEIDVNFNPSEVAVDRDLHVTGGGQIGFNLAGGADTLNLRGGAGTGNVFATLTSAQLGDGDDVWVGTDQQSYATGGDGNDTFTGGSANDVITPGPGDDVVDGGAGAGDSLAHFNATADLTIDLAITTPQPTGEGNDTLSNLEGIYGGAGDDTFFGTDSQDSLSGGDGDDRLAGRGGDDYLDAGAGFDTADYSGAPAAVTVKLGFNMQQQDTVGDGKDWVDGFEAIRGSAFADTLTGSGEGNVLQGLGGVDTVAGLGGPDTLLLRDGGGDIGDCGSGPDTVVTDPTGTDTLTDCEVVDAAVAPPAGGGGTGEGQGGGGTGEAPGGGAAGDTVAPVLSGMRFAPARFRARRGGRLRMTASEAAALVIVIERCRAKRCRQARVTTGAAVAGKSTLRLRTKGLRPGRHRVRVVAVDAAGNRSAERRARFRIRR